MLEKTIESPLGFREIQPVHPKGNQSWIFIGRTDGKLKVQYSGHLMQITDLFEKTLMLGKIEGGRRSGQQRCLYGITDFTNMSLSKLWGLVMDREAWCAAVHGGTKNQTWLNWTDGYRYCLCVCVCMCVNVCAVSCIRELVCVCVWICV